MSLTRPKSALMFVLSAFLCFSLPHSAIGADQNRRIGAPEEETSVPPQSPHAQGLLSLPPEVLRTMAPYLNLPDSVHFASTCHDIRSLIHTYWGQLTTPPLAFEKIHHADLPHVLRLFPSLTEIDLSAWQMRACHDLKAEFLSARSRAGSRDWEYQDFAPWWDPEGPLDFAVALSTLPNLRKLTMTFVADTPWPWPDAGLMRDQDLACLTTLTNLRHLDISCARVNDLTPLAALTQLTDLRLEGCDYRGDYIENLDPLAALINLRHLNVCNNNVRDITALSGLTNLTDLNLSLSEITPNDYSALSTLTNLRYLSVQAWTDVDDTSDDEHWNGHDLPRPLQALANLTKLTDLTLTLNESYRITEDTIEMLQDLLPDCDISADD